MATDGFWSALEIWPSQGDREKARIILEDRYALFLPHVPTSYVLSPEDLISHLQTIKPHKSGIRGLVLEGSQSIAITSLERPCSYLALTCFWIQLFSPISRQKTSY